MIKKCILKKLGVTVTAGMIWIKTGTVGDRLWTRYEPSRAIKSSELSDGTSCWSHKKGLLLLSNSAVCFVPSERKLICVTHKFTISVLFYCYSENSSRTQILFNLVSNSKFRYWKPHCSRFWAQAYKLLRQILPQELRCNWNWQWCALQAKARNWISFSGAQVIGKCS